MKMRIYSTSESIDAGEVSLLAIAETICATWIVVYLALWRESLFSIALATVIAPLLLLRTNDSQTRGVKWFTIFISYVDTYYFKKFVYPVLRRLFEKRLSKYLVVAEFYNTIHSIVKYSSYAACMMLLLAGSILIRAMATLVAFWFDKKGAICSIPRNWCRITLSIDLIHPPELVPGFDKVDLVASGTPRLAGLILFTNFRNWLGVVSSLFKYDRDITIIGVNEWLVLCILHVPALLYRWSLKSTSLVFLPFIWAARTNLTAGDTIEDKAGDILEDSIERLSRLYAWFVILFLTALPIAFLSYAYSARMNYWDRIDFFVSSTISPVLSYQILKIFLFVTPDRIEIGSWHLTRLAGAVITVWLYNFAKKSKRKIDRGIWSEREVEAKIAMAAFSRSCLGFWTVASSVAIILTSVRWYALPEVVIRWFPWIVPH
jgi:hypothetical protein